MAETKSRFGIPIPGATEGTGIIMPKLKYRFRVNFQGIGAAERAVELTTNVQSVTRPSISVEEVEVHSYNSKVYIQGKHTWNTIDVTFRDDITNSISKLIGAQVQRQINHYQQTTAAASNQFKFNMTLDVMDGSTATPSETWELEGCFIQNVAYGDNDYAETSQQQVIITVRYDNAVHAGDLMPTDTPALLAADTPAGLLG